MISEAFLIVIFNMGNVLFSVLPDVNIKLGTGYDVFYSIVCSVTYLLPGGTVLAIFTIVVALMIFRIVVSIIKTIWQLLPIL